LENALFCPDRDGESRSPLDRSGGDSALPIRRERQSDDGETVHNVFKDSDFTG